MSNKLKLEFDAQAFSILAAQKAAYRLIHYFVLDINAESDRFYCNLTANKGIEEESFNYAVQEFKKGILDEELRLKLKKETEPIRNLILGIAFSRVDINKDE